MPDIPEPFSALAFYVVRNREGHFFRAKGFGGTGKSWVADVAKARTYNKIGPARAIVSFFANNHPRFGVPDLIRLTVGSAEVVDEAARVDKVKEAKRKARLASTKRVLKWKLEQAQAEFDRAQAELTDLMKKGK